MLGWTSYQGNRGAFGTINAAGAMNGIVGFSNCAKSAFGIPDTAGSEIGNNGATAAGCYDCAALLCSLTRCQISEISPSGLIR